MLIKKYTQQSGSPEQRASRLEAYAKQGRSYRSTQKAQRFDSTNLLKGSLAALIPLAAAGTLNAQCQGGLNGGATINVGQNGNFSFDVDGDGNNDFLISHSYFLGLTVVGVAAIGSNRFLTQNFSVVLLPSNYTVTRGKQFNTLSGQLFDLPDNFNGYIGIRKGDATTGIPGWFHFEVVSLSTGGASFKIAERGYENDGNNSAVTGDCATVLPVEMLYFQTKVEDKNIVLDWATASEINNAGFEVQRSTDGKRFSKIGWVAGQGTSLEQQVYTFIDNAAQSNTTYYYRLKQTDIDGTTTYSDIRTAGLVDKSQLRISEAFPNPAHHSTKFELNMPHEGEVLLSVFDVTGTLMKTQTNAFAEGTSIIELPTSDLAKGQYFVKLQTGSSVEYRKLVVR